MGTGSNQFANRLYTIRRAYNSADRMNKLYEKTLAEKREVESKLRFASGMRQLCLALNEEIVTGEQQWRESVLAKIEEEIAQALAFVYPEDGYTVKLVSRVLRGKIHIDSYVKSVSLEKVDGRMKRTQGMLFRQLVSLASVICIMEMQGVRTVYIDEAFSGASKKNMTRARRLLQWYAERGLHMVIIAQDPAVLTDIDANTLVLARTLDNKTIIRQDAGAGVNQ